MAEYTNSALQLVAEDNNVLFSDTVVGGSKCVSHRQGAGIVTLRGITNQCNARYKVSFGGNIAIPTGGTVGEISVAISISGEELPSATAIVTPTVVDSFFNVFVATFIEVARNCCVTISIQNTSTQAINIQNANLIVERVS